MVSQLLHPLVAEGLGVASSQQPRLRTKKATFGIFSTAKLAPLSGQRLAYALAFRISAGAAGLNVSWPRLSGCLQIQQKRGSWSGECRWWCEVDAGLSRLASTPRTPCSCSPAGCRVPNSFLLPASAARGAQVAWITTRIAEPTAMA